MSLRWRDLILHPRSERVYLPEFLQICQIGSVTNQVGETLPDAQRPALAACNYYRSDLNPGAVTAAGVFVRLA